MSSSDTTNGTESSVKRQKTSHGTAEETTPAGDKTKTTSVTTTTTTTKHHHNPPQQHKHKHYHPCSFVTWNCNGFSTRAKHNRDQLKLLVRSTGEPGAGGPDVICIQEARLKAEGPGEKRGRLLVDDKDFYDVTEALKDAFGDYRPFWSLADKKYAGTLTLIRKSCVAGHNSGAEEERGQEREREHSVQQQQQQQPVDVDFAAFTVRSAIELILRRLGTTREECGLPEVPDEEPEPPPPAPKKKQPKNKQQQQQQTSLKSFFAAKPKPKPEPKAKTKAKTKTKTNGTTKSRCPHHPEGRFQFFFFPEWT